MTPETLTKEKLFADLIGKSRSKRMENKNYKTHLIT
jgi:hypothetical protein